MKTAKQTEMNTIFDKNSIFHSLQLQSKFSLEEQKQLNLIEKLVLFINWKLSKK